MTGDKTEDPRYLQQQLITYIGNKRALLPFISRGVELVRNRLGKKKILSLDLFSGTGIVSRLLRQYSKLVISNDIEYYSYVTNHCYMANKSTVPMGRLLEAFDYIKENTHKYPEGGFIAQLYAPLDDQDIKPGERVFYTRRNAVYIDAVRRLINDVDEDLRYYLLAPLLSESSIHANTAGVFKGFYKSKDGLGRFGGQAGNALSRILRDIELRLPRFSNFDCQSEICLSDAGDFIDAHSNMEFDLAYFDPPYNQHPYGSNYFMLNLIARYERPGAVSRVSGIPMEWRRSPYNKKNQAQKALFQSIADCPAKFLLISYNSEGFIKKDDFISYLDKIGGVLVLETPYNAFRGSRNLAGRDIYVTEFLYLLEKK